MKDYRNGMTTQEYRASYDYRSAYFEKNPGFFHCIWFCSQCGKPLFGKKNVQVDHIVPLNQGGKNDVSNCTAICGPCNRFKSDKVDSLTYHGVRRGKIFKVFEQNASNLNRGVGFAVMAGVGLTKMTMRGTTAVTTGTAKVAGKTGGFIFKKTLRLVKGVVSKTIRAITLPLRRGSLMGRLMMLAIYTMVIVYLLCTYTTFLDAWL